MIGQLEMNWPEVQLRISKCYKEDQTAFKKYFNQAGAELWPFNNLDEEALEEEGLGSAFFGDLNQFKNVIEMLDENGRDRLKDEIFEVAIMDKNQWRKWTKGKQFIP